MLLKYLKCDYQTKNVLSNFSEWWGSGTHYWRAPVNFLLNIKIQWEKNEKKSIRAELHSESQCKLSPGLKDMY